MATIPALRKAVAKLRDRWSRTPDRTAGHAVARSLEVLREKLIAATNARQEDIAQRSPLAVTTPWRVGRWQEGEPYEYDARVPIYDDIDVEIFNITAGDTATDDVSAQAIALAAEIVKAVNASVATETIIKVAEGKRGVAAGYDAAKPLTPDGARMLARKLVACADAIDRGGK